MNIVFHVPFELNPQSPYANDIRPVKMLAAFRNIGYEVDVVHGCGRERKARAAIVRERILSGTEYEFVYSECSSLPTALTDPSKHPRYPFFDLLFLRFCMKRADLEVGLFYRDIYWRFPNTGQYRSDLRRILLSVFHTLDVAAYTVSISKMYLPSIAMRQHIPFASRINMGPLPPGHDVRYPSRMRDRPVPLRLLYVGGLGELYDLRVFMTVVRETPNVEFILCTRTADWEREKAAYQGCLGDNITIVHEQGNGLRRLYDWADVAVFFLRPTRYSDFAVSVKIFEYIGHQLPIIAVQGTLVGTIVSQAGVGWTIPFAPMALRDLLAQLRTHPETMTVLAPRLAAACEANTWEARAQTVAHELTHRGRTLPYGHDQSARHLGFQKA